MTTAPQPPEEEPESWDQMAARVAGEVANVINVTYAMTLANSMNAYLSVGFSHEHAFALTLAEHRARLEMMNNRAMIAGIDDAEGSGA